MVHQEGGEESPYLQSLDLEDGDVREVGVEAGEEVGEEPVE